MAIFVHEDDLSLCFIDNVLFCCLVALPFFKIVDPHLMKSTLRTKDFPSKMASIHAEMSLYNTKYHLLHSQMF